MSKLEITYDALPLVDGEMDLSDDRESSRLFLASLLDYACAERVEQVRFEPSDGDNCLAVAMGREVYGMVPLPAAARMTYFRYIQEMVLGRIGYLCLVRFSGKHFTRDNCGPITVDVGGRRSKWIVNCTDKLVRFVRVF